MNRSCNLLLPLDWDINKKRVSNVEWKRCYAPLDGGGFGVCSIWLANASFLCKLTWDILTTTNEQTRFIRHHYFHLDGRPRSLKRVSSIRPGLHSHIHQINDRTFWLVGNNSKVNFWTDNWLGYRLSDKFGIPHCVLQNLCCTVGDYLVDGVWFFTSYFITRHLDVVIDILQIPIHYTDERIWPSSGTGILTSRHAYDFLRSHLLRTSWAP